MIGKVHQKKITSKREFKSGYHYLPVFSQEPGGAVSPGSVTTKFSPCVLTTDSSRLARFMTTTSCPTSKEALKASSRSDAVCIQSLR